MPRTMLYLYTAVIAGLLFAVLSTITVLFIQNTNTVSACLDNPVCIPWGTIEEKTAYCKLKYNMAYDEATDACVPFGSPGVGMMCPDQSGRNVTHCAVLDCPYGDTNGDGECLIGERGDTGATYQIYDAAQCPSEPPSGCGQIDWYIGYPENDWVGNFCGHTFLDFGRCQNVEEPQPIPNVSIIKTLENAQNPFTLNTRVPFAITINNTGETTLPIVEFRDTYDHNTIQFIGGQVSYQGQTRNITNTIQVSDIADKAGEDTYQLRIPDLTQLFNADLAPTQTYQFSLSFRAVRVGNTENIAIVEAGDLSDNDNEIVVIIGNPEPEQNPQVAIRKVAQPDSDGDTNFLIGQEVAFDITLTNTGETDLNYIRFIDEYNPALLNFVRGSVQRRNSAGETIGTINDIATITTIRRDGYLEIANLANSIIGGLKPQESYRFTFTFITERQGVVTNFAISNTRDIQGKVVPRVQSQDTISIENVDTDI